jgi:predicted phosphodiesterase
VRYLILSDIHANWEALQAVLRDAQGDYDEILCCGDLVGYGADPNLVVDWARQRAKLVVRGNHDKACTGLDDLEWFNPVARSAATWTIASLTPDNLSYLRNLPRGPAVLDSFQILHGSPLDEDDYLVSNFAVTQIVPYLERQVSFFGHTHIQGGFLCRGDEVLRLARPEGEESRKAFEIERDVLYLINPGSVGQPRDRDPRAGYLIYAPDERRVEFRRVPYDVPAAQAKIRDAGLSALLADRLEIGG